MTVQSNFDKIAKSLKIKAKPLNDLPFRKGASERLLNAFMNGRSGLNDRERS